MRTSPTVTIWSVPAAVRSTRSASALDGFERAYVASLLEHAGGNVAAAARASGLNRTYLYRLLRRHGVR